SGFQCSNGEFPMVISLAYMCNSKPDMETFEEFSGKLTAESFRQFVQPKTGFPRKEILQGPDFGVDTAVIDLGNNLGLAVASDPLSLIPSIGMKASAWLSVHLLANDMATTGFAP